MSALDRFVPSRTTTVTTLSGRLVPAEVNWMYVSIR